MSSQIENHNLEVINFNKEDKNSKKDFYLKCLDSSNSLHYLEKEDIINLLKCSKSIYDFVSSKNMLLFNLLYHSQS